ncbi:LOW QUALITY PROTEIN: ceramide synthase 5 [Salvelinus sp. IW2-2015]|uniref:LOW QUALITY PROTEIN: ceramide synthase 5 n=1 Tax=Salvelinus sp. IW2-2015 TaxID=2691554 RepID=UPI0038D3B815
MAALSAWFWNERFWLPHNVTWADLADPALGVEYPKASHLLSVLPLALGIFAVRILFERFIASPCAFLLHIHAASVHWRATPNPVLEKVFTSITKCPDWRHLDGLSKQLDWDVRKIQRWFRHRRNQDKPSILTKFCESMWRSTFYLCIFTYGIRFLWQCPWMWDTHHCWYNYPTQVLTPGLYHYYMTELGFYWSLMFSQFTDIKRKDFPIMFIHHLATVSLISFSYANNMLRVGSLVMWRHDASDFILEAAKLANYAKYQRLCDFLFVLFAVVFFITRLVIYPLWLVKLYGCDLPSTVSKDDRSDVESSSEEEADTNRTNDRGVKMAFSSKAENGTNGTNGTNGHVITTKSWPQIRTSSR